MGVTSFLFRTARTSADVDAVRKEHVIRRVKNHIVGRVLARAGVWRRLWR